MITLSKLLDGAGYDIDHVKGALKCGFEDALGAVGGGDRTGAAFE